MHGVFDRRLLLLLRRQKSRSGCIGGIEAPDKVVNVVPTYPAVARAARVEGVVILEAVIDESGNVTSARVLRGDPLLAPAALDAVQQWKFKPARVER